MYAKYRANNRAREKTTITLLHFNDVYNIEAREKEPVGGAARFATAVKQRKHLNPLLLFSGDAFNPSIMSSLFKGRQMAAVLNAVGVNLAVYGNHDFDFGVDKLVKLSKETTFPWLLSNIYDNLTSRPLAEGKISHIIEWEGKKLGFVGLVEKDWIATLSTVDEDDVTYVDFVEEGRTLARELREEGAEFIIALTHMRWPNDKKLAQEVDEIDLVLGGHDHDFNDVMINGKHVIKSGTDFRYMCQTTLTFEGNGKITVGVEEVTIDGSIKEDETVKAVVDRFAGSMGDRLKKVLGVMKVPMDGRFAIVRTQESNLGNFITDIMLTSTNSDVAFLNAGSLRSDRIHPAGEFCLKDLMQILPYGGCVCVLELDGETLHKTFEIGVSKYPEHEGRFPQVAGMKFEFDPSKAPRSRIDPATFTIDDVQLDFKKKYRVAVNDYVAGGHDGYDILEGAKQIINEEEGPVLHSIIQNHFQSVRVIKGEKELKYGHKQAIIAISRMKMLVSMNDALSTTPSGDTVDKTSENDDNGKKASPPPDTVNQKSRFVNNLAALKRTGVSHRHAVETIEKEVVTSYLEPKVEGRITILAK